MVTPVRKVRLGAYIGCPFLNCAKFANNSKSSSAVRALAIESDHYRNQDGTTRPRGKEWLPWE